MSPQRPPAMRNVAAFVRLSRLKFLLGGFAGFALGAAVAAYEGLNVTFGAYASGQAMVTAFHLMTHYANEYFDRAADRHGRSTEFSGGSGVLVRGELRARTALRAALACAGAGALGVAGLALAGNPAAALLGAAIGIGAWCYSAPPVRLAARGLGEIDAAVVVAVLVPLTGYAAFARRIDALALTATAAPALAMFVMMIAVEWPDRDADAAADKRNLVVRLGARAAIRLAAAGALLVVPALLAAIGRGAPLAGAIFAALLLPFVAEFIGRLGAPAVEIAARGVTMFLLTVLFELLGYVTVMR